MSSKPPGRPPLDVRDPSVNVHIRLPTRQYDEAWHRAHAAGVSVPEILRRDLRRAAAARPDDEDLDT
jgi:hypothetical protein